MALLPRMGVTARVADWASARATASARTCAALWAVGAAGAGTTLRALRTASVATVLAGRAGLAGWVRAAVAAVWADAAVIPTRLNRTVRVQRISG